jgi:hypothetical protein
LKQRNSSVKDLVKKLESAASGKSETNLKNAASSDKRKSISVTSLPAEAAAAPVKTKEELFPSLPAAADADHDDFGFAEFNETKDGGDQVRLFSLHLNLEVC